MRRLTRYSIALLVAGAVVVALAQLSNTSLVLLIGIGLVYAVGSAVVLRPEVRRLASMSGTTASAVFSGVTSFAILSIGIGITDEFHVGAATLTFGLAYFGFVSGVWLLVETAEEDDPERPSLEDVA